MEKIFPTKLIVILSLFSSTGFCQPDSLVTKLKSAVGIEKAEAYFDIIFFSLRVDPAKARLYLKESETFAQQEDNEIINAYANLNRGIYYSATGILDSAAFFLEGAKRMAQGQNDRLLIRTESSLGKVYISLGNPEKGLQNLFEALRLLRTSPDRESEIKVRINIMWAYLELKRYEDCIHFGRGTLNFVTPAFEWMLPYIYNNMAVSYGAINQIDSARYFIEKSIPIAVASNDTHIIANAHFILGTIYSNSGQYNLAIEQYQKAKPYREKIGNALFIVSDNYTLSDLYAKSGQYDKGIEAGLEALRMAEQNNLTLKFEGVYEALAKNYEGLQDFRNASKYYSLWAVAKDSIYKNATSDAIAEMQTKYETEKKELLIQEQRLKLERNQVITIGLVTLLLLVASVVVLWRNQLKLREQQKLDQQERGHQETLTKAIISLQEKERSRFAKDLHDGFGQLITALKLQVEKIGIMREGVPELIQHMHDEIRNVSFALSPQVLTRDGLVPAVKELSFRINRASALVVNLQTTGLEVRLPSEVEIALYRVCQEWINNVLKYGEANKINIQLINHPDEITLMIEDNGKGFEVSALEKGAGNGWKNIQSRIRVLKGVVEVDSVPGRPGTTFTVNIPKNSKSFQQVA